MVITERIMIENHIGLML